MCEDNIKLQCSEIRCLEDKYNKIGDFILDLKLGLD